MAKTSQYQQLSVRAETTYGDTTTDFADGVLVRTVGAVDIDIRRGLVDAGVLRTSADDAGVAPVQGQDQGTIKIAALLPGATRSSGAVTADATTTFLSAVVGAKTARANDSCDSGCTTTVIQCASHPYSAGDLVLIAGEVRRVASATSSAITLDAPLSSAPSAGTTIYGVEQYDAIAYTVPGVGVGISASDTEVAYACAGCNPSAIEIDAVEPGKIGQIAVTLQVGSYSRGTVTHATTEACTTGVVAGAGAGKRVLVYGNSTTVQPYCSQVQCAIGVSREWVADVGSTQGRGGVVTGPADASVDVTAYQDGTLSAVDGLIGHACVVCVQIGSTPGSIWGVYYPEAYLAEAPKPVSIGIAQGVAFKLAGSRGILFRA